MADLLYCITCERIVPNWGDENRPVHTNVALSFDDADLMNCYGPFAYSTPPNDLPENWHELVQEPSPEELAEMDANAEALLDYLEG